MGVPGDWDRRVLRDPPDTSPVGRVLDLYDVWGRYKRTESGAHDVGDLNPVKEFPT